MITKEEPFPEKPRDHRLIVLEHKERWEEYAKVCKKMLTTPSTDIRNHITKRITEQ